MRVAVITNFPSYHQVDLFNDLQREPGIDLKVFYLRKLTPGRQWKTLRAIDHPHEFIKEWRWNPYFYVNPGLAGALDRFKADVTVITQYASVGMQWLMYRCGFKGQKWIFWSEAPGIAYTELPIFRSEWLRRTARRMSLLPLSAGRPREVWGIGEAAMLAYQRASRCNARNVPYYSDQTAFQTIARRPLTGPVRFLFAGKLNYRKGFDLVIEAITELARQRNDFEVTVIGDGPYRQLIEQLTPPAADRVKFSGFKELDEVPGIFAQADALLFPSRYDGWGMGLVEGMAAAMPVIGSTETNSARALLQDGVNGYLLKTLTGHALAEEMIKLLEQPDRIRPMGEAAREAAGRLSTEHGARTISQYLYQLHQEAER
jgi:glycosyltransferase involved in cell wall biosynthesis